MSRGEFNTKVAGVSASNTNGESRQRIIRAYCKSGMSIYLKREPTNAYDNNAVVVSIRARKLLFIADELQIGYLNKRVAEEIARYMDGGGKVTGKITEVTGGVHDKHTLGVNILLTKL